MSKLKPYRTETFLCLLLSLYLLFPGFWGYRHITASKGALFVLLCLASFFLCRREFKWGAAAGLALASFGAAALSTLFSLDPLLSLTGGRRWEGLGVLALYYALFALTASAPRREPRLLAALGVGLTGCSLVALLQLWGDNPLWLYPPGTGYADNGIRWSGAFLGTVGNADLLAAVNALAAAVFAAALGKLRDRRRLLLLVPLALTLAVMLWDRTAAGLVGLAAAALFVPP
ncbi:MAG: hypothetical protein ACSW8F_04020, partial [bacterium]